MCVSVLNSQCSLTRVSKAGTESGCLGSVFVLLDLVWVWIWVWIWVWVRVWICIWVWIWVWPLPSLDGAGLVCCLKDCSDLSCELLPRGGW